MPDPLVQITFPVGPLACNCTLLGDDSTGTAVVIDPGAEIDRILMRLAAHRWRLIAILVTHAHIDHIGGAAALKRATSAPVWLNPRDLDLYSALASQAQWLGLPPPETVAVDAPLTGSAALAPSSFDLQVIETPGHTQGSVCIYVPAARKLFAGDTLFAGSIGRTDLPGGDGLAILQSIRDRLLPLPDETLVIPGHGPETTIARERATNPFLVGARARAPQKP